MKSSLFSTDLHCTATADLYGLAGTRRAGAGGRMKELIACERNAQCQRRAQAHHAREGDGRRRSRTEMRRCCTRTVWWARKKRMMRPLSRRSATWQDTGARTSSTAFAVGLCTSSEVLNVVATVQNELQMKQRLTDRLTDQLH